MSASAYYFLEPCCNDQHPVYLKSSETEPLPLTDGVYIFTGSNNIACFRYQDLLPDGSLIDLESCLTNSRCYKLTYFSSSSFPLSFIAGLDSIPDYSLFTATGDTECPTNPTEECPCSQLPNPIYHAYSIQNCCGGTSIPVYTITDEITLGVNFYDGADVPDISEGCYTVSLRDVPPSPAVPSGYLIEAGNFKPDICESEVCTSYCNPCTCVRFKWVANTQVGPPLVIEYWDCTKPQPILQEIELGKIRGTTTEKVCYTSLVTQTSPEWIIEEFGDCKLSNGEYDCPSCYRLEDCAGIADDIFSLDPNLATYADTNQSITIVGSNTCWKVYSTTESCDCAIATTLDSIYYNCEDCNNRKSYKLTECTTGQIIYTTTDLSQYKSIYISIDCPGCWYVEQLDIIPPTTQPVTVVTGFESCELCNATYYRLTDCSGAKDDIITTTDLSDHVGDFIKIKYCPETCWEVTVTDPEPITGEVIFDSEYIGCSECLITNEAKCVTFTNTSQDSVSYGYINANGISEKFIMLGGQIISKVCVVSWEINEAVTVTEFGLCIDGICPSTPQPKRKVTPGYNTPTCSTDYYENVECHFSEWMYKDALSKRYGISNCCPEELTKWLIKHEMLMLEVLVNPDYECSPTNTCGCPQPCDCGYIGMTTTNTTCRN